MVPSSVRCRALSAPLLLLSLGACVAPAGGERAAPVLRLPAGFETPSAPDVDLPDAGGLDTAPTVAGEGARDAVGDAADAPRGEDQPLLPGALSERVRAERREAFNPYVITAHRHNYVLPIAATSALNEAVYRENDIPLREGLEPVEVKFQISLKTQLNERDLFVQDDALSFGFTLEAWWQLYSKDLSSPFRETNYAPELFYLVPLLWGPFGGSTAVVLGLEHQSNGQVQGLSRSWNRLYASLLYERGNFVATLQPWYRLPEEEKEPPDDPEGDDNPDILDFVGHGQIALAWRDSRFEYALRVRGDPVTGKGAVTIGTTFPLTGKFRGFVQYVDGYGDSLIDYDHYQRRLGIGVALTNLF